MVIIAVWSTTRPLESSLLHRRNYQITFELPMPQMNSLITSHIDVDCQVVTKAGRLFILILLFLETNLYQSRVSMAYNTIYKCKLFDLHVWCYLRYTFVDSSKAHFLQAITSITSTSPSTGQPPALETSRKLKRPTRTHPCPHANCPQVYKQLSGLRYHLSHVSPPYLV